MALFANAVSHLMEHIGIRISDTCLFQIFQSSSKFVRGRVKDRSRFVSSGQTALNHKRASNWFEIRVNSPLARQRIVQGGLFLGSSALLNHSPYSRA